MGDDLHPTSELRWNYPHGAHGPQVLQQRWLIIKHLDGGVTENTWEWRDIPIHVPT